MRGFFLVIIEGVFVFKKTLNVYSKHICQISLRLLYDK
jgi:hypothetical protein